MYIYSQLTSVKPIHPDSFCKTSKLWNVSAPKEYKITQIDTICWCSLAGKNSQQMIMHDNRLIAFGKISCC